MYTSYSAFAPSDLLAAAGIMYCNQTQLAVILEIVFTSFVFLATTSLSIFVFFQFVIVKIGFNEHGQTYQLIL